MTFLALVALLVPMATGGAVAFPSQTMHTASPPQDIPTMIPTSAPAYAGLPHELLFARQQSMPENTDLTDAQICGWISAASMSPLACNQRANVQCSYARSYVRCCEVPYASDCTAITACLPYTDVANDNTGSDVVTGTSGTISCPMAASLCNTISLEQYRQDNTYVSYFCGQSAATFMAYQTIDPAASSAAPETSTATSVVPTTTTPATDTGSSTNVSAIAGGTVGGVVALAAIGSVIGFLVYRKRRARKAPRREVSQYVERERLEMTPKYGSE